MGLRGIGADMYYAMTAHNGRITELFHGDLPPDGFTAIDGSALAFDGVVDIYDYVVVDGVAVFDPTQETLERMEANDRDEVIDMLPDAFAELSMAVSDGATDTAELADALADLSLIVSGLVNGE